MIVEDEVITQRYLKEILEQHDVNVSGCFDNAEDTIDALKNTSCEMILMDINISGAMDGIQLARHILQTYTLPIVFISAYSDDETLEEVLELSPYGFITKPFSSKEVLVTLQIAYKRFLIFETKEKKSDNESRIILTERYSYSMEENRLYCDDKRVDLNAKQCKMIKILVKNINQTVSFDELTYHIWGENEIASSALRTFVYTIRKKLPDFPLYTDNKQGYYLKK